jgi:hypothetical protein
MELAGLPKEVIDLAGGTSDANECMSALKRTAVDRDAEGCSSIIGKRESRKSVRNKLSTKRSDRRPTAASSVTGLVF